MIKAQLKPDIVLATIAFNTPWVIKEQHRLLDRYLKDKYALCVFDNSNDHQAAYDIKMICRDYGSDYIGLSHEIDDHEHWRALNFAADYFNERFRDAANIGFLDHDVFPTKSTTLVAKITEPGFYGVGQRHVPTDHLYLWPGFCFFSRKWLNGRKLDFGGIRGKMKRDDGDTGSLLWPLFAEEDWAKLYWLEHGYRPLRRPDSDGLQSWGYEILGDWVHLTNASGWKDIPDPEERERLARDMVYAL